MENKNANTSIECTVYQCKNHCKDKQYCSLNCIKVGTHEANPTEIPCTDCESFRLSSDCQNGSCNF